MRVVLAAALAAFCVALVPATAQAVTIGIGDQKATMFSDPRFLALKVRHARISIGWDAMRSSWQRTELQAWLAAADKAGVQPLITFGHSRLADRRRVLPKPEQLRREFRKIRTAYPWVRTFAAWNEANHCGEPTCHRAPLVAAYYRALKRECRLCTVLPAELLDMPNMISWTRKFLKANGGDEPDAWGLHNYVDTNRFQTKNTRRLLEEVTGDVWLTEVGGIVRRRNAKKTKRGTVKHIPESTKHAAEAMRFLFRRLIPLSPRIRRVYVYHWNSATTRDSWDSALISATGFERPAFKVLTSRLAQRRAATR